MLFPTMLLLAAVPVAFPAPTDVADLTGAKGASGEIELKKRGYQFVDVSTGRDRKTSRWWHAQQRQCLRVVTHDGRYQSITALPAPDCTKGVKP